MNKFKKLKFPKKINLKENGVFSYASFSIKKQAFFAKRLSFLIKAGVPVLDSMHQIKKQTESRREQKFFNKIVANISNGQTLATSLENLKGGLGSFAINIIRAGESSGTLAENLNYLADELKKKEILRKKIVGALLYPIIVTLATFGIAGFLTVYIFPKIIPIFHSLKAKLPLSTRIVIFISDIIRHHGLLIIAGLLIFIIGIVLMIKNIPRARLLYDGLILRIPFVGKIAKNYNLTNTTRILGLLLKSGLPLFEALTIASSTTNNAQYKKALTSLSRDIMKGKNLSFLINGFPILFPKILVQVVSTGEQSGNLSNTFLYLSEFYENEFDDYTKNLSSAIEPVLMIIMGIMVGFIAISVITPIYEITNSIHK